MTQSEQDQEMARLRERAALLESLLLRGAHQKMRLGVVQAKPIRSSLPWFPGPDWPLGHRGCSRRLGFGLGPITSYNETNLK
jgi:hypothetical protein